MTKKLLVRFESNKLELSYRLLCLLSSFGRSFVCWIVFWNSTSITSTFWTEISLVLPSSKMFAYLRLTISTYPGLDTLSSSILSPEMMCFTSWRLDYPLWRVWLGKCALVTYSLRVSTIIVTVTCLCSLPMAWRRDTRWQTATCILCCIWYPSVNWKRTSASVPPWETLYNIGTTTRWNTPWTRHLSTE